jgi:hypothetical protein
LIGNTFTGNGAQELVSTSTGREADIKILGSIKENDDYQPTFGAGVTVLESDL